MANNRWLKGLQILVRMNLGQLNTQIFGLQSWTRACSVTLLFAPPTISKIPVFRRLFTIYPSSTVIRARGSHAPAHPARGWPIRGPPGRGFRLQSRGPRWRGREERDRGVLAEKGYCDGCGFCDGSRAFFVRDHPRSGQIRTF